MNAHPKRRIALFMLMPILSLAAQDNQQIEILYSDYMEYDRSIGSGVVKYVGDVGFRQDEVYLYCDSAWFFTEENKVHAYRNVHIIQADTLHVYGDELEYSGNSKMAEIRHNVKMVDKETTLTTSALDFDLDRNIGFYEQGGHIINGDNTLDSERGYYYSRSKMLYFRDSVVIVNPDYTIYADTLKYHTETEIAFFLGPTEIISEENYIYCENGWYDTRNNISQFNENAYLASEGQLLYGDSLRYERETGMGMAFDNVELHDTANDVILEGRYAIYIEEPEYAMLTDSAVLIQVSEEDTLYVHADTLKSVLDSAGLHKIMKAYYHVKFYSREMQGKCDSLTYLERDSVFQLVGDPVIWSKSYQLTAVRIDLHMDKDQADYIDLNETAFIASRNDSIRYTQVRGRNMTGFFQDGDLRRIDVSGNGQTLYFARDEAQLIGVNKAESSNIDIFLADEGVERINMKGSPNAVLHPPFELTEQELYLSGFLWLDRHRPTKREEIFQWND